MERAIRLHDDEVRAFRAGTKTVLRRLVNVKERPASSEFDGGYSYVQRGHGSRCAVLGEDGTWPERAALECPVGQPGDRLWGREAWGTVKGNGYRIVYRSDGPVIDRSYGNEIAMTWGSAARMPRTFLGLPVARIFLDVIDVRIERLHAITDEDARAEGVRPFFERYSGIGRDQRLTTGELCADAEYRASAAVIWDELFGDKALWITNPWIWRVAVAPRAETPR